MIMVNSNNINNNSCNHDVDYDIGTAYNANTSNNNNSAGDYNAKEHGAAELSPAKDKRKRCVLQLSRF